MPAVLLDTCAIIYVGNAAPIAKPAENEIILAALSGDVMVSPVSAWEIGMLAAKKRVQFLPDPKSWFQAFLARNGVRAAPLTPEAAVEASFLPSPFSGDPADRLLVATALDLDIPIVTRDRSILAYARAGHVKAIAC